MPSDFGTTVQEIEKNVAAALRTGRYCLDYWEGDVERNGGMSCVYYVRPVIASYERRVLHPSWGGVCTFLGPAGCALSFDKRPFECRDLVPGPGRECFSASGKGGKEQACRAWRKYRDVLEAVAELVNTVR